MRDKVTGARRWVVKIGSALLTADGRGLDRNAMAVWVEQMVALQGQAPDPARHPLYQVGFAMQPAAAWPPLQGGVSLQQLRPPVASAHMDIDLYVLSDETGLQLELNYLSELFDAARMQNLLQHYQQLLASVCAPPEAELL